MQIVFISNFFNHHQKYLSEKLYASVDDYIFVTTNNIPEERIKLGYLRETPKYVVDYYSDEKKIKEILISADIVIAGSVPEKIIKQRIKAGKIIFRYQERPLKSNKENWKHWVRYVKWHKNNPRNKPIYLLCASAYTASDYAKFNMFKRKAYKWGYFPEIRYYEDDFFYNKDKKELLWCGRFLDWKHPDTAILVAERLKKDGYSFHLKLIGMGEMASTLNSMISEKKLEENVSVLPPMSPSKIRDNMERAGIYLFTSDREEGWGAVLNEAMNSGCAVVASHAAGSTPYLIQNEINGMIYESGNVDELYKKVKYLLDNPEKQHEYGKIAYRTICESWNAEIAVERFLNLVYCILQGDKFPDLYTNGPCSKAEVIDDEWYYG